MTEFKSRFADDINKFLDFKEALGIDRKSTYNHIKAFDGFCATNRPDSDILIREIVLAWLSEKSDTSKNRNEASAVRQFGKYLNAIGKKAYILPDKFVINRTSFVPYIPSDSELSAFFYAADSLEYNKRSPRAYLIFPVLFRLLYTCGLRPNEGRELKTEDINLKNGEIFIRQNKQHKERIVVMSDDMLRLCVEYDTKRKMLGTDGIYFFSTIGNKPFSPGELYSWCNKCWKAANPDVPKDNLPRLRPYDFRHCFASVTIHRWLDERRELEAMMPFLRAYMGHSTFESTFYYVHLLPETLVHSAGVDFSKFENLLPEVE